jgi:predicted RNase H-like nuclease (RuvC/YqgF family)
VVVFSAASLLPGLERTFNQTDFSPVDRAMSTDNLFSNLVSLLSGVALTQVANTYINLRREPVLRRKDSADAGKEVSAAALSLLQPYREEVAALRRENQGLRDEVAAARCEVAILRQELAELRARFERLLPGDGSQLR